MSMPAAALDGEFQEEGRTKRNVVQRRTVSTEDGKKKTEPPKKRLEGKSRFGCAKAWKTEAAI